MSINEALNILGLNSNFSEKELKRAYYALVKKYHPDQFEKSSREVKDHAETMMKKINQAYETLQNMSKSNGFSYGYQRKSHNTFDVKAYVYIKKAELEQKYLPKKYKVDIFAWKILKIKDIINDFYIFSLQEDIKENVDKIYNIAINYIINVYKEMEKIYFQEHKIDINNLNITINYDCGFDEFYEQLESIKNKYEQLLKVFQEAFAIKQEIAVLQVIVEEANNAELLELFTKLKTNFDNGCSFNESRETINYLKHLIYLNDNLDSEIDSAFARVIGIVNSVTEEESELRKTINIWLVQLRNDLLHTSLQNANSIINLLNLSSIKQIIEFLAKWSRNCQKDNSWEMNNNK